MHVNTFRHPTLKDQMHMRNVMEGKDYLVCFETHMGRRPKYGPPLKPAPDVPPAHLETKADPEKIATAIRRKKQEAKAWKNLIAQLKLEGNLP